jgi:hypothetical protein
MRILYGLGVAGCAALGGMVFWIGLDSGRGLGLVVGTVCVLISAASAAIFVGEDD